METVEIKRAPVEQIITILIEAELDMAIIVQVVRRQTMIKEELVNHIETPIPKTKREVIIKLLEKIEIKVLDFLVNLKTQQMRTKITVQTLHHLDFLYTQTHKDYQPLKQRSSQLTDMS